MRNGQPGIGETRFGSRAQSPAIDWDPVRGLHRASGHGPRKQAGHMTCTRPLAERQNPLALRAPSTHDPGCVKT